MSRSLQQIRIPQLRAWILGPLPRGVWIGAVLGSPVRRLTHERWVQGKSMQLELVIVVGFLGYVLIFCRKLPSNGRSILAQRKCSSYLTWGTHFAATKEPASMSVKPVLESLSINSILVLNGIDFFSFCNPSRAPTSTILTWSFPDWFECS